MILARTHLKQSSTFRFLHVKTGKKRIHLDDLFLISVGGFLLTVEFCLLNVLGSNPKGILPPSPLCPFILTYATSLYLVQFPVT